MVDLTVETYNLNEQDAVDRLPNRILEAAQPGTFNLRGYPTRASADSDVWRFVDAMHELGLKPDYEESLGGLTGAEFKLYQTVARAVSEFTEARFGRRIVPKGALIRAFFAYRTIRQLSAPSDTTVFEIGPGSGFLGALLALSGYRYAAHEIAQGFYMAQSTLWANLFPDTFVELASDPRTLVDFEELPAGTVLHVPWWKFYLVRPEEVSIRFDVATANHTLCEMQTTAFKYALRICRHSIGEPAARPKYFLVEGPGADDLRNYGQMCAEFDAAGYVTLYREFPVDVFVPKDHSERYAIGTPADSSTDPTGGHAAERLAADETAPAVQGVDPSTPNRVSEAVLAGIVDLAGEKRVPFDEVHAFNVELAGGEEAVWTEDEAFMRFAYGTDHWS